MTSLNTTPLIPTFLLTLSLTACTQTQPTTQADRHPDQVAQQTAQFAQQQNSPPPTSDDVQWIGVAPDPPPQQAVNTQTIQISQHQSEQQSLPLDQTPTAPPPLTQQQLIQQLAEYAGNQSSDTLRPYIRRAALAVFDPTMALTDADMSTLSPEDRQIILAWQQTFSNLGQTLGEGTATDRQSLEKLAADLADQVNATHALRLNNLKLCKRVNGYGVYDQLPSYTFLAGSVHPMIVYAEVDNFADRLTPEDRHVVELTQEIVLYNESDGLPVWRHQPVSITDESFNRRRDFFVVQIIQLSERLTVGKYQLKVTLTDTNSQQVDEATLPIQIVADPQLTK